MDQPDSSTPIRATLDSNVNHSVDDLLEAINNNLSSSTVDLLDGNETTDSLLFNTSDDAPITPLKFKNHALPDFNFTGKPLLHRSLPGSPCKENVMQNIPRAPSFDELEFNTRLNRTASNSRVGGPRQLSNSSLSRTLSNRIDRSSSFKSPGYSTRENSPSKRSVCFDQSPPKIVEYNELTPQNSDDSFDDELEQSTFNSQWDGKLKSHSLPPPPPPPKHQIVVSPPQKDTTIGSSDDSQDDSQDFNLTKEDLTNASITLERKLDLVLGSDEVSRRVQEDQVERGSSSPSKSSQQQYESAFVLNIKNKNQLAEEQSLRDVSELFEMDLSNNDKQSHVLRLDPMLKRRDSNSSLRDEERALVTATISMSTAPITLTDGLKDADLEQLPDNHDIISMSESTHDSFTSATDVFESEPISVTQPKTLAPSHQSQSSISTIVDEDRSPTRAHKKKLSLSESINSFISSFTKSPRKPSPTPADDPVNVDANQLQPVEIIYIDDDDHHEEPTVAEQHHTESTGTPQSRDEDISAIDKQVELSSPVVRDIEDEDHNAPEVEDDNVVEAEDSEGYIFDRPRLLQDDEIGESSFSDEFKASVMYDNSVSVEEVEPNVVSHLDRENVLDGLKDDVLIEHEIANEDVHDVVGAFNAQGTRGLALLLDEGLDGEQYHPDDPENAGIDDVETSYAVDNQDIHIESNISHSPFLPQIEQLTVSDQLKDSLAVDISPVEEFVPVLDIAHPTQLSEDFNVRLRVKEVAVQTDDVEEYRSLKPSFCSSSSSQVKAKSTALPSFNSTLFHDKTPVEDAKMVSPPTSFIEIWHNQPKQTSPDPQYRLRKISPPSNVLRMLSTRRNHHDDEVEIKEEVKLEPTLSRRASLEISKSFIATSVSRSSFINVDSKRSSIVLDSSFNADLSGVGLPDLSQSSDFGAAFNDWVVPQQSNQILDDTYKDTVRRSSHDDIRAIWGNSDSPVSYSVKPVTPVESVGNIERLIGGPNMDNAHVRSTDAVGEVVVTKTEDVGLDIEFDHDSEYDYDFDISDYKIKESSKQRAVSPQLISIVQSTPEAKLVTGSPIHVIKADVAIKIPKVDKGENVRLISGASQTSVFDLNDEFDRAVQLQDQKYVAHERQEMILASEKEYDTPAVTPVVASSATFENVPPTGSPLLYGKTRGATNFPHPQGPRVRTPLTALSGNSMNKRSSSQTQPKSTDAQTTSELKVTKRGSRLDINPTTTVKLPLNDKGRLYIHINSLKDVQLKQIKNHKASFKLYVDNGKHTISTPKMELDNEVSLDKEFELAVDGDRTDLFFTLKVSYQRPETELVDVYEKVYLNNHRLSRLIGLKPKYRVEKRYETRKKTVDDWDNRFAQDGSFGKNKISFLADDNQITFKSKKYTIELFNEWEIQRQNGKEYKKSPFMIGNLDVTMMFIPRTSPLENLPPSIRIANEVAQHVVEQSKITKEGFLFQEGGDCQLWKRRFVSIQGTKMTAHTDDTKKPRAQINLLKVVDVIHSGNKSKVKGMRNVTDDILMNDGFKLKFKNGEVINFNAETSESKKEWIGVLERIVTLNKLHQPWVKKLVESSG